MASLMTIGIPPILQPYTAWQFPDDSPSLQVIRKDLLAKDQVKSIARQVRQDIIIESIDRAIATVTNRIDHQNEILQRWKAAGNEDKESDASEPFSEEHESEENDSNASGESKDEQSDEESDTDTSAFSERVRQVIKHIEHGYHCHNEFEWDVQLLSSIVDTGKTRHLNLPVLYKDAQDIDIQVTCPYPRLLQRYCN